MKSVNRASVLLRHLTSKNDQLPGLILNEVSQTFSLQNNNYEFTLPNKLLSEEQRQFYEENGFVLIKNLIPDDILDLCAKRFVDICDGKVPVGFMTLMKDISLAKTNARGEFLYNKVQNIVFDDVFALYMLYSRLLDYVECFTGPNIMAVHSMLINKPPDAGTLSSRHPLHQDLYYFPFRPAKRVVGCWTAMEKVSVHNGCLFVLPGTHKGILHQHDYPDWNGEVNKMYHGVRGFDDHPKVYLEMSKGDTVFFHPLLIHGSGPNSTKGFRKAISCHYAASECEYINVKGTIQENIANEVEEVTKRKGISLEFCTLWKLKSRLARGTRINL